MKNTIYNLSIVLTCLLLSGGCNMINKAALLGEPERQQDPQAEKIKQLISQQKGTPRQSRQIASGFSLGRHNKTLNDYAQQLVMKLEPSLPLSGPIAVASFVEFDSNLVTTNMLGNQFAEALMIEMGNSGYPVADINAAKGVKRTAAGNFAFTRKQSVKNNGFCCVLSGNLIYEKAGVRVNAKLLSNENSQMLGASTLVIPYFVVQHLGYAKEKG